MFKGDVIKVGWMVYFVRTKSSFVLPDIVLLSLLGVNCPGSGRGNMNVYWSDVLRVTKTGRVSYKSSVVQMYSGHPFCRGNTLKGVTPFP